MTRTALSVLALLMTATSALGAQETSMSFFITSVGPGDGANLQGLGGADAHCTLLAEAVGAGEREWHAYLSTIDDDGGAAVNARDRIGSGPWFNANGVMVAANVAQLHSDDNNLGKATSITESGNVVNGRGDHPNTHDILTGSNLDGTAFTEDGYDNCENWTSNADGNARVGHHDRNGGGPNPTSWNSAHSSRGCSQANLQGTGGNGLFYCFAVN